MIAQPEDNTPSDEPQGGDETDASKDPPAEPVENEKESENGGGNGNETPAPAEGSSDDVPPPAA